LFTARKSKEEQREEEEELFTELYEKWKGPNKYTDESYKAIPKFYFKVLITFYITSNKNTKTCHENMYVTGVEQCLNLFYTRS